MSANNSAGESALSTTSFLTTDKYVPAVLSIADFINPPQRTSSSITVDWSPPRDNGLIISAYEIKFRCPLETLSVCPTTSAQAYPAGSGFVLNAAICAAPSVGQPCTTTSYQHTGLTPNTAFQYAVRSFNGYEGFGENGWSLYSPWVFLRTSADEPLVPPLPGEVSVVSVDGTGATLNWRVPNQQDLGQTPPINRYRAVYSVVGSTDVASVQIIDSGFTPGERFNLTLSSLLPFTTYEFSYQARTIQPTKPDLPKSPICVARALPT